MVEFSSLHNCTLCPRACGVDRYVTSGFCGAPAALTAARAALHFWEEPCISGSTGSGAGFFSGCNMRCVFCQNHAIAAGEVAREISVERLSEIFLELQNQKACNINLVTALHYQPQVISALEHAKAHGLTIPIVYNSGGYESVEALRRLDGLVDIYLPDCKYYDSELAQRYSNAPDYFEICLAAIDEMLRQVGDPRFMLAPAHIDASSVSGTSRDSDPDRSDPFLDADAYNTLLEEAPEDEDYTGPLMKRGVIIRHLLLPTHLSDSREIVTRLLERYGNHVYLSLMNQYTPLLTGSDLVAFPELGGRVSDSEYESLLDTAIDAGIENGFFQMGGTASDSFIPAFDYTGL